jgi:ketosteroid isomerase-like protein
MDEALRDKFRTIYSAIQAQDFDAVQENVAHDIEWALPESLPWGGVYHGHLGVAAMSEIYLEHVDGSWAEPDEFMEYGDTVVVLGRTRGRGLSSGVEFEVPFAHVWMLSDGVPRRFRGYLDSAPIATALTGDDD